MKSVSQVEEAVLHEGAHYGGRVLFGNDMSNAYQKLWMKLGGIKGLKARSTEYGFAMDQYFKTADNLCSPVKCPLLSGQSFWLMSSWRMPMDRKRMINFPRVSRRQFRSLLAQFVMRCVGLILAICILGLEIDFFNPILLIGSSNTSGWN